jgi:hypothetical protein
MVASLTRRAGYVIVGPQNVMQMKKYLRVLILVLLLTACSQKFGNIGNGRLPEFLAAVFPSPGSRITKEYFEADLMSNVSFPGYEGHRPVDEVGYQSNICVYFDAAVLGLEPEAIYESGETCEGDLPDELTGYCYVIRRISMSVDGKELTPKLDDYWFPVGLVGTLGTPYWLCWPTELDVGRHEATLQFRPTEEVFEEYRWSFTILE